MNIFRLVVYLTLFVSPLVFAEDQFDLEEARIFGNRDLPNITYVVPWKDEELEAIDMQPVTDFFNNALQPLDRDVFLREMEHLERLQTPR